MILEFLNHRRPIFVAESVVIDINKLKKWWIINASSVRDFFNADFIVYFAARAVKVLEMLGKVLCLLANRKEVSGTIFAGISS